MANSLSGKVRLLAGGGPGISRALVKVAALL